MRVFNLASKKSTAELTAVSFLKSNTILAEVTCKSNIL